MRARDIVGKKIVGLSQKRVRAPAGNFVHAIAWIQLDDGSAIKFHTLPLAVSPITIASYDERKAHADR